MHPLHANASNSATAPQRRAAALVIPNSGTPADTGGVPLIVAVTTPVPTRSTT